MDEEESRRQALVRRAAEEAEVKAAEAAEKSRRETGAPIERLPFEDVAYWPELTQILEWSRTNCFRRLGICWGAQALLYHFHNVPKYDCGKKLFGVYPHQLTDVKDRLMRGFTDNFPMPVSRFTEPRMRHWILKPPASKFLLKAKSAASGWLATR